MQRKRKRNRKLYISYKEGDIELLINRLFQDKDDPKGKKCQI